MRRKLDALPAKARRLNAAARGLAALAQRGAYDEIFDKVRRRLRPPPPAVDKTSAGALPGLFGGPLSLHREALTLSLDAFLGSNETLRFPESANPKLGVVLVMTATAPETLACLRALLEQRASVDFELIVVDDTASPEISALLRRVTGATVFRNDEPRGLAVSARRGASGVRAPYLLVTQSAATLLPGALATLVEVMDGDPDIGAVGGRVVDLGGRLVEAGGVVWNDGALEAYGLGSNPRAPEYMFSRDVDYCAHGFLLVRTSSWGLLGGIDDGYVEAIRGLSDLCLRLSARGLRVVYEPRAVARVPSAEKTPLASALRARRDASRFRASHAATLATRAKASPRNLLVARFARPRRRLLFIEDRAPHPHLGMGYPRSFEMLRIACDAGYDVTLLPTIAPDESWPSVYSDLPRSVEVALGYPKENIPDFLGTRVGYYDVMLVARPHNMVPFKAALAKHPRWFDGVRIVYDAEALFCLRKQAYQELIRQPWSDERLAEEIAAEVALTKDADVVFSVSPLEKTRFEEHGVKDARLLVHTVDVKQGGLPFSERRDLLFVGSMHFHPSPNSDSILWFVDQVFPLVRAALGDVRLLIAGPNSTTEVAALASDAVRVLGMVPDLDPLFDRSRLFIAPTRYSAGVPIKVCEASARGIPCVTSDLVASQLGWKSGHGLLSASTSDAEAFAAQCIALYTDEALWNRVRTNALELVSQLCSRRTFAETLRSALAGT